MLRDIIECRRDSVGGQIVRAGTDPMPDGSKTSRDEIAVRQGPDTQRNIDGGIVDMENWVNISNVMLIDPESGEPTRIRFETQDGKKVRVAAKSGKVI